MLSNIFFFLLFLLHKEINSKKNYAEFDKEATLVTVLISILRKTTNYLLLLSNQGRYLWFGLKH